MAERGQRTSSSRSRRGIAAVAVFLFGLTAPVAAADIPSTPNGSDWVTDGPIYSVAHVLGRTFIGGDFSFIGPRSGLGAPIGTDGHPAAPFPEVSGPTSADGSPPEVDAVAPDGSGGWYIGGSFSFAGGSAHANLAHISPSGAVDDSFNANANGTVRAIAVATAGKTDAGNVYVGGDFTSINGLTRQHAAAVDATTGAPNSTWKPDPDGSVYALAESYASLGEGTPAGTRKDEPLVFLGGPVASLDKVSGAGGVQLGVHGLAAIWGVGAKAPDGATSLSGLGVAGWTPNVDSGTVRALAASSAAYDASTPNKAYVAVYVGGDMASSPATGLGAVQFSIPYNVPPTNTSRTAASGTFANWSAAAGCTTTPPPNCSPIVRALTLSGTSLYVAGDFGQLGTTVQQRIGQVAAIADVKTTSGSNSATVTTWPNAYPDALVRAIAVSGSVVYLGGDFGTVGSSTRHHLAAVDTTSGTVTDWDPEAAGGTVDALAASGSATYAGGSFTSLGAVPAHNLAALDSTGAYDPAWQASADDGPVHAFAVSPDGSTLYVGGGFTTMSDATASGQTRNHIAALSTASGTIQSWDADANGWILALSDPGGTLYAGGSFTHIGGADRNYIAALDGSGGATAWNPGANDYVRALDASCDTVYAGGSFTHIGGLDRDRIAAIGAAGGTATDWDPSASSVVYSIVSTPDRVYAGGGFTLIGSAVRYGIAALDRSTGMATTWNPVAESPPIVRALALGSDGTVYAGGSFIRIGDADRNRLGAVDPATGKATAWDPEADTPVYALATSGNELYAGGTFRQVGSTTQEGFASFGSSPGTLPSAPVYCPGQEPAAAPPPPPPPPAPDQSVLGTTLRPALVLSQVSMSPRRFRVGHASTALSARTRPKRQAATGTLFRWRLSEPATVRIAIFRRIAGHLVGRRCQLTGRAARAKAKRCVFDRRLGTISRRAGGGAGRLAFSGRLGKTPLAPGGYGARIGAATADGRRSRSINLRFQVMPR